MSASVGLETLDYLAIVAYLAATWWIAYRATRKTEDTEDFFLGGREMPWFIVGLSIMATLLSTNTYLGLPGEIIKFGPAYIVGYAAYPFIYLIVSRLWIPFFMRMRLTSAYEYLERRFDFRARLLGDALFLLMRLGWMSMVVYTGSVAMAAMAPAPLQKVADFFHQGLNPIYPVVIAVGVAATIYACVGGIKAVIWTDVLQAVMLFGGVAVIIGYTMWSEGTGPATWWRVIKEDANSPDLVWVGNFNVAERTTVLWAFLSILAWSCCTHCSDQVALQRYFTTNSTIAARRSFVVSLASSAIIGLLLAVSGLALRYYYMRHLTQLQPGMTVASSAEQLMPRFFADVLPAGFGGLILVSFLCDALQTLGSGVNSIAAIISRDTAQHGGGAEAGRIRFARISTLFVGGLTTCLAVVAAYLVSETGNTIINMLPKMFNMFLGPLAVLFMIGMFYRRATPGLAIAVVLFTQLASTTWSWWPEIAGLLAKLGLNDAAEAWVSIFGTMVNDKGLVVPRPPSVMLAIFAPVAFGLLLGAVVSALFGSNDHKGVAFTWKSVLSRPSERPDTT